MTDSTRLSLQLGHCAAPGGGCTLGKSECSDQSSWSSSGSMIDAPYRAHGGYCLLAKTVREAFLGKCGFYCSPKEACAEGEPFTENYSRCQVQDTLYGSCGNRCSWSPADCDAGETWKFPDIDCSCDLVQIGGCMSPGGDPYCAVSADGCDEESVFLKPLELKAQANHDCFVCMATTVPLGEKVAATAKEVEETAIIQGQEKDLFGSDMPAPASSSSVASAGMIIGVAIGSVALVSLLITGLLLHVRKQKQKTDLGKESWNTGAVSAASGSTLPVDQHLPPMAMWDMKADDNEDMVSDIGVEED